MSLHLRAHRIIQVHLDFLWRPKIEMISSRSVACRAIVESQCRSLPAPQDRTTVGPSFLPHVEAECPACGREAWLPSVLVHVEAALHHPAPHHGPLAVQPARDFRDVDYDREERGPETLQLRGSPSP